MSYPTSDLSQENILRDIHDPASQTIRVSAQALVPPGLEIEISAADGDNILVVGTEDGSVGGTQHAFQIGSDLKLSVKDVIAETSLASIDTKVATAANQVLEIAELNQIDSDLNTFASTNHTDLLVIEGKQDVGNASLASIDSKLVDDYGSSTLALRTASQIGNTAGPADFNSGTTGAQTLRTSSNITRNGNELSYNSGASDVNTIRTASNIYDSSGSAVTIINPVFTTESFEKFFRVIAASKWMDLANYDQVIPTYSVGDTVLTLAYKEDGALLGEVVINYSALTTWDITLNRYIDDDNGTVLLDDDDTALNLD